MKIKLKNLKIKKILGGVSVFFDTRLPKNTIGNIVHEIRRGSTIEDIELLFGVYSYSDLKVIGNYTNPCTGQQQNSNDLHVVFCSEY